MTTQAETARNILIRHGDQHLIEYLAMVSDFPVKDTLWSPAGSCVLAAGSLVNLHNHPQRGAAHYHFSWIDPDENAGSRVEPAQTDIAPLADRTNIPVIRWPDSNSILLKVAERADRAAALRHGETYYQQDFEDETAIIAAIHTLAPSARPAVNQTILESNSPDGDLDHLDQIQYEYADDAIATMASQEFAALVDFMAANAER